MDERRVLVVANRTLCEPPLLAALIDAATAGPIRVKVLVPVAHPAGPWADGEVEHEAHGRLEAILHALEKAGIHAEGEIGDASPVTAVGDLLRHEQFDEVIVSTLPHGVSKWLAGNVVRRMRAYGLPVTHVVSSEVAVSA